MHSEAIAVKVNRQAVYDKSGKSDSRRKIRICVRQRPLPRRSAISVADSYRAQLFEMASFRGMAHCLIDGLAQSARLFLRFSLYGLPKADTGTATVLIDELDAGSLQGSANSKLIGNS
jgi:hypothetical protein